MSAAGYVSRNPWFHAEFDQVLECPRFLEMAFMLTFSLVRMVALELRSFRQSIFGKLYFFNRR